VTRVSNRTTFIYDAANRLVTETDATNASITFAYDAVGRQISTTDRLARRHDSARRNPQDDFRGSDATKGCFV
jgi:YD repeat-containing protein